jgi:hypothetical protein
MANGGAKYKVLRCAHAVKHSLSIRETARRVQRDILDVQGSSISTGADAGVLLPVFLSGRAASLGILRALADFRVGGQWQSRPH